MSASLRPRPLASLPTERLSTGCPHLDAALSGGLPVGSLTELAGEAAASKTQLSLQLLLTAQLPREAGGLGGSAVYIYTEGEPPLRRLHQLAQALPLRYPPEVLADLPDPSANVFVEKSVANGADLLARLQRLRPLMERQRRAAAAASGAPSTSGAVHDGSGAAARAVRLLVIDSVAHVFRELGESGGGVGELAGRTELLFRVSTLLRRLADEFSLAVLLVNQVVDAVTDEAAPAGSGVQLATSPAARHAALTGGLRLVSLGREVVPALGLAWANCVNTRLFLARCGAAGQQAVFHGAPSAAAAAAAAAGSNGGASAPALRKLQVVFSPHLPQAECHYVVEATGVRGLHPAELEQHDAAATAAAWEAAQQEARERRAWEAAQHQQWQAQQQEQHQAPPQQQQQQQQQQGQWQQQQQQQVQQQWHQGRQEAVQHCALPPPQQQEQQQWPQDQQLWHQWAVQAPQQPAQYPQPQRGW